MMEEKVKISIAAISDLHGSWMKWGKEMKYPDPELVIVAGDICRSDVYGDQEKEIPEFLDRLQDIFPASQQILVVPGNHDFWLERNWKYRNLGYSIKVLVDQEYTYESWSSFRTLRVYGGPWTDCGGGWAFQKLGYREDIAKIPRELDILITHEAPRFYGLRCIKESIGDYGDEEPGCKKLADKVDLVKPKVHVFGHIHKPCVWDNGVTKFYNVSGSGFTFLEV